MFYTHLWRGISDTFCEYSEGDADSAILSALILLVVKKQHQLELAPS
jgi:hypothetical protein